MIDDTGRRADPADRRTLRELGRRIAELAHEPHNADRRARWTSHNDLRGGGPMVLVELGGLGPSGEWSVEPDLRCRSAWARDIERQMRAALYRHDHIRDDAVIEPWIDVPWSIALGDLGVPVAHVRPDLEGGMGAYRWDPPIKDLRRDLDRLRPRVRRVDRDGSLARRDRAAEALDGVLGVRMRFGTYFWWTVGLTWTAIDLVGLDSLMLWMYDDPDGLHRLMAFLRDDALATMDWAQSEGLLTPNNECDYVGSGSLGYTSELPRSDPGAPTRIGDLWGLCESQETVGVGPSQFEEFIFPYQRVPAERFGLLYYGCCEPVHNRWHIVSRLPNLRKVSVSPWCDEGFMAEALGDRCVYARKPSPALVSTPSFDEDAIREDIRATLRATRGRHLEIVLKDVHTVCGDVGRLARWVEMAREEIARA